MSADDDDAFREYTEQDERADDEARRDAYTYAAFQTARLLATQTDPVDAFARAALESQTTELQQAFSLLGQLLNRSAAGEFGFDKQTLDRLRDAVDAYTVVVEQALRGLVGVVVNSGTGESTLTAFAADAAATCAHLQVCRESVQKRVAAYRAQLMEQMKREAVR